MASFVAGCLAFRECAQQSVHRTGGYVARFQAFSLPQPDSVKMALSCPSRQPVTRAVSVPCRAKPFGSFSKLSFVQVGV